MSNYRTAEPNEKESFFRTGGVWSTRDSIYIQSPTVPAQTVEAYFDTDGEVKTRRVHKTLNRLSHIIEYQSDTELIVKFFAARALQILYILFAIHFAFSKDDWHWIVATGLFTISFFIYGGFTNLPKWIVNTIAFGLTPIHRQEKKNHAAEHKTIRAFRKYGRLPTIDEAKKMPKRAVNCGTNDYPYDSLIGTISSILVTVYFMIQILSIEAVCINFSWKGLLLTTIVLFMAKYLINHTREVVTSIIEAGFSKNILTVFQLPFLGRPTEKELNLANAAVKAYIEMEEEIKANFDSYQVLDIKRDDEKELVYIYFKNGTVAEYDFEDLRQDMSQAQVMIFVEREEEGEDETENKENKEK